MTTASDREWFNKQVAPKVADKLKFTQRAAGPSLRFAYFEDDRRFLIIAGEQEKADVELALAYGLGHRDGKRLVLALPHTHCEATLQRIPWLRAEVRPDVWLHDAAHAERADRRARAETLDRLADPRHGKSPEEDLASAATPTHLGKGTGAVAALVEWATKHPLLDPGHRRGERAWHCMGQKVLAITTATGGVKVTAGIHYRDPKTAPQPTPVAHGDELSGTARTEIQTAVEHAIAARLTGPAPIHRSDEHWLQAVIRRDPTLVGVEQPALREVPAWRPRDDKKQWGRGYIDLVGMDGHGDLRIVETKIASNADELLVLQGLDYYVWARAYLEPLRVRLGAPKRTDLEIHYVIGAAPDGTVHPSRFTRPLAEALDDTVRWRFQIITDWSHGPNDPSRPHGHLLPAGALPE